MSQSWIVVQNAEDVQRLLSLKGSGISSSSVITTSAEAYFDLLDQGVACRGIHEFISDDITNSIAFNNFDTIRRMTSRLDEIARDLISGMPDGCKPFHAIESELKKVMDSISFIARGLSDFFRNENPGEILYWDNLNDGAGKSNVPDLSLNTQSLVSVLLRNMNRYVGGEIKVRAIPVPRKELRSGNKKNWRQFIYKWLNPNRIQGLRFLGRDMIVSTTNRGGPTILVFGKSGNLRPFLRQALKDRSAQIDWWTEELSAPARLNMFSRVKSEFSNAGEADTRKFINSLREENWSEIWGDQSEDRLVLAVFRDQLEALIKVRLDQIIGAYMNTVMYLQVNQPIAVFCGTVDRGFQQIVSQAASLCGIPVVSFQHGGTYGYIQCEWMKLSDLRADIYAGFGRGGCKYIENFAEESQLKTRAVDVGWYEGSVLYNSRLNNPVGFVDTTPSSLSTTTGCKTVLYAPTGLNGDLRYGPYHDMDDTEYCIKQLQIIQCLISIPGLSVSVKLHPKDHAPNPLSRLVYKLGVTTVETSTSIRLPAMMEEADLVLLDFPTTTLLEAMAMGKRLVYIDLGIMKWTDEGKALIRDTVPWVDSSCGWESDLKDAVTNVLNQSSPEPNLNAFLKDYARIDFETEAIWDELLGTPVNVDGRKLKSA